MQLLFSNTRGGGILQGQHPQASLKNQEFIVLPDAPSSRHTSLFSFSLAATLTEAGRETDPPPQGTVWSLL